MNLISSSPMLASTVGIHADGSSRRPSQTSTGNWSALTVVGDFITCGNDVCSPLILEWFAALVGQRRRFLP